MIELVEGMKIAIIILSAVLAAGVAVFIIWGLRVWLDKSDNSNRRKMKDREGTETK